MAEMRGKARYYSLLFVGLALLLVGFTMGCGQSQSEAYQEGYKAGFTEGYEAGFAEGREAGLAQSGAGTTPAPSVASDKPTSSNQTSSPTIEPVSTPAPPLEPARFALGDLTITPTAVKAGEVVTISIPVTNTGGMEGSYTVVFKVKDVWTTWENVEVTLNPGQTKTVTYTTKGQSRMDASGQFQVVPATYTVSVNGKVGQFTVTAPAEEPEEPQVITDLAHIEAVLHNYSDGIDPEPDGILIRISFYDSESGLIELNEVPLLTVTIKLYDCTQYSKPRAGYTAMFYQDTVTIQSYTSRPGTIRLPYESIRIPLESLTLNANLSKQLMSNLSGYYNIGAEVTVTTPNQGDFSVTSTGYVKLEPLYSSPP